MRTILGLILVLLLAFSVAPRSRAQIGFEAHGLYGFEFNGDSASLGDLQVKSGAGGGASFFFSFIPAVRVEAGVDYIKTKVRELDDSELRLVPLTAAIRVGFNLDALYLYLGGGAGYSLGKLYPRAAAEEAWAELGKYEPDLSNDPIYFALAGAELVLSENFGVRVEYRYNRLRTHLTWQDWRGFEEKEKFNLDHQQARAGLVVYF